MASKKKNPEAPIEPTPTTDPAQSAAETPAPKAKVGKKKPRTDLPELRTIELASEGYLGSLEARGSSRGTVSSYQAELRLAANELGEATDLRELTVERVVEYFRSPRVVSLRSGREKSPLSIAKTRRVFRQLVLWALDQGWIDASPLPPKDDVGVEMPAEPEAPAPAKKRRGITVAVGDNVVLDGSTSETAA